MRTWQALKQNPKLWDRYFVKEYLIHSLRNFFIAKDYHELESPILTDALPQERYLDVFSLEIEQGSGASKTAYLIPSTETFNKKILAAGIGNHFVITKVFRGLEQIGPNHSPEFTMLEWYDVGMNYRQLMQDCEVMITEAVKYISGKLGKEYTGQISYQGQNIDLSKEWYRFSISELVEKYLKTTLAQITDLAALKEFANQNGIDATAEDDWQTIFELVFANLVEPNLPLDRPMFLYDYPRIMCPLTKVSETNPLVCEKVELYMAGKEIGNGYSELIDADEQRKRFLEEQAARAELGKKPVKMDTDLVDAIASGMPVVAGMGMGLDRLAMILADAKSISDINYFPASEMFS